MNRQNIIMFAICFMFYFIGVTCDEHSLQRKQRFDRLLLCLGQMYEAKIIKLNPEKYQAIDPDHTSENIQNDFYQSFESVKYEFLNDQYKFLELRNISKTFYYDTDSNFNQFVNNLLNEFFDEDQSKISEIINGINNDGGVENLKYPLDYFIGKYLANTNIDLFKKPKTYCRAYIYRDFNN